MKLHYKIFRQNGFTLVEMLIVMTVIAILAMLTIPTVIMTNKERTFADMLNQTYQKVEMALILDKVLDFDISNYTISAITKDYTPKEFSDLLKKKLKIINYCDLTEIGCFGETTLTGYKLRMTNGSGILINKDFRGEFDPIDNTNKILGATYIDIDGPQGANKAGLDQFGFYTTYKGLIPMGGPKDNLMPFSDCLQNEGFACTAWVLINKNMDYKKCPKVINWENRKTCN